MAMTANECIDRCKSEPECKYFNYNGDRYCALLKDCAFIDDTCVNTENCIFGQVECKNQHEFALVATGWDGTTSISSVEIVDLETFKSCPIQQKDFPRAMDYGVALRNGDNVMICGGYDEGPTNTVYRDCYEYQNGEWNHTIPTMSTYRRGATSVEIRPDEWLILGGYNGQNDLDTTEIFQNGVFTLGPKMPVAFERGSAVMFNSSHLFVAAGSSINQNWFLDINTWTWTEIAPRILTPTQEHTSAPSVQHASGIFYDPILGETAIANVGQYGIEIYYPALNSWVQQTTPLFDGIHGHQVLQLSTKYFITTGGREFDVNGYHETTAIYHFDHNGVTLMEENALNIARHVHVAITIPENQINCY